MFLSQVRVAGTLAGFALSPSYPVPRRQSRPFICTPYVAGPDGRLTATLPDRCPTRACRPCTRTDCDLQTAYYRRRKTGPGHPLAVVHCRTHGAAFTLYPPGYAPYRRQSVLRLSHDGSPILPEKHRDGERADFDGTLFESALDARITGVARELSEQMRVSIAMVLSVDCLGLREGSQAVGYRGIGKAICSVLAKLQGRARRAMDLLTCGALVGCWGEPLHWDAARRILERARFPRHGTRGVP